MVKTMAKMGISTIQSTDKPTGIAHRQANRIGYALSSSRLFFAQLSNEELFGLVKTEAVMTIGIPTSKPPLNEPRALWNVVQKTPLWLLFTYIICVLAVWGLIFVVLFKLKTIFELGKAVRVDD